MAESQPGFLLSRDHWDNLAKHWAKNFSGARADKAEYRAALLHEIDTFLPFARATAILDSGCGDGALMAFLLDPACPYTTALPPACTLTCADYSAGMVDLVRARAAAPIPSPPAFARVQALVQDAGELSDIPDASYSHVLADMAFFHTPSPRRCLHASYRVLQPNGVLGFTVLEKAPWLEAMNEAARVRPGAAYDLRHEWNSAEALERELRAAGFRDVVVRRAGVEIPFATHRAQADRWWGMPPYDDARRGMTAEEFAAADGLVVAKLREFCAEEPGFLHGVNLLAVARK